DLVKNSVLPPRNGLLQIDTFSPGRHTFYPAVAVTEAIVASMMGAEDRCGHSRSRPNAARVHADRIRRGDLFRPGGTRRGGGEIEEGRRRHRLLQGGAAGWLRPGENLPRHPRDGRRSADDEYGRRGVEP